MFGDGEVAGPWLQLGWLCTASVTSSLKYLLHSVLVIAKCQLFNEGHPGGEPLGHVCFHCVLLLRLSKCPFCRHFHEWDLGQSGHH